MKLKILATFTLGLPLISTTYASSSFHQSLEQLASGFLGPKKQEHHIQRLETGVTKARLNFLPKVDLNYSLNNDLNTKERKYYGKAIASFNLFNFGRDWYRLQSSVNKLKAGQAQLNFEKLEAQRKAAQLLLRLIMQQEIVSIHEQRFQSLRSLLALAQIRYRSGLISSQEVAKIRIDILNTHSALQDQIQSLEKQKANALAQSPKLIIPKVWPWNSQLFKTFLAKYSKPLTKLKNTPGILAKGHLTSASLAGHKSKLRTFLPSLDLRYEQGKQFSPGKNQWDRTFLISISFPLFDGLSRWDQSRQTFYNYQISQIELENATRLMKARLNSGKANLKIAITSLNERLVTRELARKLYRDGVRKFRQGKLNVSDLLLDQNRSLQARELAQNGLLQAHLLAVDYCIDQGLNLKVCFGK